MLPIIVSPLMSIISILFSPLLDDNIDDAITSTCEGEQSVGSMGHVVEPYVLIKGLKVTSDHAQYILEDPYMLIDPYMIDGILFDECIQATQNDPLEDQVVIARLNVKILHFGCYMDDLIDSICKICVIRPYSCLTKNSILRP